MRFLFRYNKQINAARSFEESMEKTTLCYLEKDGQYLMLHRVKKENDHAMDDIRYFCNTVMKNKVRKESNYTPIFM